MANRRRSLKKVLTVAIGRMLQGDVLWTPNHRFVKASEAANSAERCFGSRRATETIASGALDQTVDHIVEMPTQTPYLSLERGGVRQLLFVYDAEKAEEVAVFNEPLFQALNVSDEQRPVLTAADQGSAIKISDGSAKSGYVSCTRP